MSRTTTRLPPAHGIIPDAATIARIEISGQLDVATAPAVAAACRRAVGEAPAVRLDIDLHALEFCDAAGLSVFVCLAEELRGAGGTLRLVAVPARTARIVRISRLEHLLG